MIAPAAAQLQSSGCPPPVKSTRQPESDSHLLPRLQPPRRTPSGERPRPASVSSAGSSAPAPAECLSPSVCVLRPAPPSAECLCLALRRSCPGPPQTSVSCIPRGVPARLCLGGEPSGGSSVSCRRGRSTARLCLAFDGPGAAAARSVCVLLPGRWPQASVSCRESRREAGRLGRVCLERERSARGCTCFPGLPICSAWPVRRCSPGL